MANGALCPTIDECAELMLSLQKEELEPEKVWALSHADDIVLAEHLSEVAKKDTVLVCCVHQ